MCSTEACALIPDPTIIRAGGTAGQHAMKERTGMKLLKRCPHCGGVVVAYRGFGGLWTFRCQVCKALTIFESVDTEEEAVELWDRRYQDER